MIIKEVTSKSAYNMLKSNINFKLIDVRTAAEWQKFGVAQLESQLILLSWRIFPNMTLNTDFESQFKLLIADKSNSLFFICKSGYRSFEAAYYVLKLGYANCYNIIDGFEGTEITNGWKNTNLPWQNLAT